MRYLLIYISIFTCTYIFGQESINPCIDNGEGPETNLCREMECYFKNGSYVEAYSTLLSLGNETCSDNQEIVKAKTLAANYFFDKALRVLENLTHNQANQEIVQREINRITKLKILSEKKNGTYIRNLISVNTKHNDLVAFTLFDSLFCLNDKTDTISFFPRVELIEGHFHFPRASMAELYFGESFFGWENFDDLNTGVTYNDSLIYLTALPHQAFGANKSFEIICLEANTKKEIDNRSLARKGYKVMHPAIRDSILYFSSDIPGGQGGMDLYKVIFNGKNYGELQNLGPQINTAANEVFPALSGDTLFFASDRLDIGYGGLDIYKSALSSLFPINLGMPVNTAFNDFCPTPMNGEISYFVSNRDGGKGGNDIYKVTFAKAENFFQNLAGKIDAKGQDMSAVIIQITSADGTFSKTTSLEKDGSFSLAHIKGLESYSIEVVDGNLPEGSKLALFGEEGNVIKEVGLSANGQFKFELLTPNDYFLEMVENHDQSVLSVDILGMIESDDLPEEGFKIYLEDSDGEVIGIAVTDDKGNFTFKSVKPDDKYVIKSKVSDPKAVINIMDKDGKVISSVTPTKSGEFAYVRLSDADRVITLTNESEQKVKIADNELFNLPVLYFGYNETKLNSESQNSLELLVKLLERNPSISLEISGFTDSRGAEQFNLKLSQERIDAVVAFLNMRGIRADRLVGKGYGETKLLNKCGNGVECSEEEHAVNRRTEIRIYQPSEP